MSFCISRNLLGQLCVTIQFKPDLSITCHRMSANGISVLYSRFKVVLFIFSIVDACYSLKPVRIERGFLDRYLSNPQICNTFNSIFTIGAYIDSIGSCCRRSTDEIISILCTNFFLILNSTDAKRSFFSLYRSHFYLMYITIMWIGKFSGSNYLEIIRCQRAFESLKFDCLHFRHIIIIILCYKIICI